MFGADVIIGGVNSNGPYFTDRWATAKREPKIDDHQDWELISASENNTHTILNFGRPFDTCDPEDLPITSATTKVIWSMGMTDVIQYHAKRGSRSVNMFDPAPPKYDVSEFDTWELNVNTSLPNGQDTVYWCTCHRSPDFPEYKKHIVGFEVMLDNEEALAHNHHMILHNCLVKKENYDLFESYLVENNPGGLCYTNDGSGMSDLVAQYCQSYFYVWAKGGGPLFIPDNGERFDSHKERFSFLLREHEAGVLSVGNYYSYTMMIPPNTDPFVVNGHCSSQCTNSQFPELRINVFNVLLHSHLCGRKIKLRHYRNGTELPWISTDDHYDFNYQQNRALLENRQILPGDGMTTECTDSTTGLNNTTFGGLSTKDEMCDAYLMYFPRMELHTCSSAFQDFPYLLPLFGIEAVDSYFGVTDPTILSPASLAGKKFSEVVNAFNWTPEIKAEFQNKTLFSYQRIFCAGNDGFVNFQDNSVNYPEDYVPYEPPPFNCT
ncbi:unnamed protein product [Allacma fusca]|uniref:DOMON domain-containing protein n=1 Tax=Allacma fusca TaxID=39272 RepID=A0A8J2KUT5_9HEXA|nr:unnamed protein product [Allacma fusca]